MIEKIGKIGKIEQIEQIPRRLLIACRLCWRYCQHHWLALGCLWGLSCLTRSAAADPIIPISADDKTATGSDLILTLEKIFQKEVIPLMMILGSAWLIWSSLSGIYSGLKESQEKQNFGPFKDALIRAVTMVVIGAALLYLLFQVTTYTPAG